MEKLKKVQMVLGYMLMNKLKLLIKWFLKQIVISLSVVWYKIRALLFLKKTLTTNIIIYNEIKREFINFLLVHYTMNNFFSLFL